LIFSSEFASIGDAEIIFSKWISLKNTLPRLVEKISADFSLFLFTYQRVSPFVEYFYKLISGQLSRCKLLGVSDLYPFVSQTTITPFSEKFLIQIYPRY
jgi:hypothetical protein